MNEIYIKQKKEKIAKKYKLLKSIDIKVDNKKKIYIYINFHKELTFNTHKKRNMYTKPSSSIVSIISFTIFFNFILYTIKFLY